MQEIADGILLPMNHMIAKTDICITLDVDGNFRQAEESKLSISIPCTEDSSTRVGNIEPHSLHEQLGYLALDEKKCEAYLNRISAWSSRNSKVKAVHTYIANGKIIEDLRLNCISLEGDISKVFIRFRVESDLSPNLWEDSQIAKAWQEYCAESDTKEKDICYATGKMDYPIVKHPKGTNMATYGAKLVSCNDETNYTYKGRFRKYEQANVIGREAGHKAHAMLKYLIATQGYKCDTQAIVVWAVDDGSKQPDPFEDSLGLYGLIVKTERDNLIEAQGEIITDYAKQFCSALSGYGNIGEINREVAVMAVDAATTGRMGITFYQALPQNDYIDRVVEWHESCSWWFSYKGKEYISAPKADRIIAAVFGEPKGEGYNKVKKQARERLLYHIVCGYPLDRSWMLAAVNRVSQPFSYSKKDGGWDYWLWYDAFNVACAIIRKYYAKEGFGLELDKNCRNRSYLFGRLLAVADRLESHARYLQEGKSDTNKRPTNAVRYMSAFASKPMRTWKLIYGQLSPYIQRLNGAEWYQQQIDEIMSTFEAEAFSDKALDGRYTLGYSLQRRALTTNRKDDYDELEQKD